ncbi:hypothetical protein HF086_016819 [Spodoptera exigua]|uniref:Uncharacterized protein n=1 Tax=Spodoptera exigua TaxID=7107 RepID=A0A922SIN1_SPOEX|nr:hypothetical protein HF086_016819 [Spodoptera exigua]
MMANITFLLSRKERTFLYLGLLDSAFKNENFLPQMFLSFTDKSEIESDIVEVEQLPSPETIMTSEDLDTVTAL